MPEWIWLWRIARAVRHPPDASRGGPSFVGASLPPFLGQRYTGGNLTRTTVACEHA
jgi:hypothetical protein